jgi:hypothetical protein
MPVSQKNTFWFLEISLRGWVLTVEQPLHHPGGQRSIAAMRGGLGFRRLYQQPAHRMTVERVEQSPDLIAVSNIAARRRISRGRNGVRIS